MFDKPPDFQKFAKASSNNMVITMFSEDGRTLELLGLLFFSVSIQVWDGDECSVRQMTGAGMYGRKVEENLSCDKGNRALEEGKP